MIAGILQHDANHRAVLGIIFGQQDTRHLMTEPWLSGNLVELAHPVTKWATEVRRGEDIGATSIALLAISAGVFGFPVAMAAEISVAAARSFAPAAEYVQKIVFCLLDDETHAAFEKALAGEKEIGRAHV